MKKPLINLDYLRKIGQNDPGFVRGMIQSFLVHAPSYINDMEQARRQKKWDQVALSAHKLKPSATYMGIEGLLQQLEALESLCKQRPEEKPIMDMIEAIKDSCQAAYGKLQEELDA